MCSNIRFKCEQKPYPICNLWYYEQLYGIMWTWSQCQAMFTSYRIGFCSVSQNYTVWCEHTFPSIFMLSMSLKTLFNILMFFDGKNNDLKKNKRQYSSSNDKRMSKVLKINFVLSNDEIQFLHSLANSSFGCYCSRSS